VNTEIENMVMRADLGCSLDLKRISGFLTGSEYDPEKFPGLIYRMEDRKMAVLIFSSGNLVLTGARDLGSANEMFQEIMDRIDGMGFPIKRGGEPVVQNLVVSGDLGRKLDLSEISSRDDLASSVYDPAEYPGLIINLKDGRTSMIVLLSGRVVITGDSDLERMTDELNELERLLSRET